MKTYQIKREKKFFESHLKTLEGKLTYLNNFDFSQGAPGYFTFIFRDQVTGNWQKFFKTLIDLENKPEVQAMQLAKFAESLINNPDNLGVFNSPEPFLTAICCTIYDPKKQCFWTEYASDNYSSYSWHHLARKGTLTGASSKNYYTAQDAKTAYPALLAFRKHWGML